MNSEDLSLRACKWFFICIIGNYLKSFHDHPRSNIDYDRRQLEQTILSEKEKDSSRLLDGEKVKSISKMSCVAFGCYKKSSKNIAGITFHR
ncbi:hypothetical protein JTE90_011003 [Oedothorax gibbosus]|uniref:Uncharacterized protein n=1 Tax=Oedothorax gibbosus TaxID=931172 RepID=A0AAV6VCM7_9ARAC|nr:hypothetical protein JTE90_011003 [Oedothorax gibbosus]